MVYLDFFVVGVEQVCKDFVMGMFFGGCDEGVVIFGMVIGFDVVVQLFYYDLLVVIDVKDWYVKIEQGLWCVG